MGPALKGGLEPGVSLGSGGSVVPGPIDSYMSYM